VLTDVESAVAGLPGVREASVRIVWDEAWSPERLADTARTKLRFLPPPSEAGDPAQYVRGALAGTNPPGGIVIGDAIVFDGVAHPFNFDKDKRLRQRQARCSRTICTPSTPR
jgi:metal-sulfur cluster biosynthetic enzyme